MTTVGRRPSTNRKRLVSSMMSPSLLLPPLLLPLALWLKTDSDGEVLGAPVGSRYRHKTHGIHADNPSDSDSGIAYKLLLRIDRADKGSGARGVGTPPAEKRYMQKTHGIQADDSSRGGLDTAGGHRPHAVDLGNGPTRQIPGSHLLWSLR